MEPLDYLDTLITGMEISSIPIQKSELELLRTFMLMKSGLRAPAPAGRAARKDMLNILYVN
jgi:hypothetical protein